LDNLVLADAGMMVRLFENLISNAIRYGKEGKYIDIDIGNDHSYVYVHITNYGSIIPKNDLEYKNQ
jgi:signal transduction histidine kinase